MKNNDEKIIIFLVLISTTTLQNLKLKLNLCMERVKWTKLHSLGVN